MSSLRIQKINELIRQELATAFLNHLNLPTGCLATINKVDTSADLGQSKIWVSIIPSDDKDNILEDLNKKAGFFRHELGQKMVIRKIPSLRFVYDSGQEKIARIDELIDKINTEQ